MPTDSNDSSTYQTRPNYNTDSMTQLMNGKSTISHYRKGDPKLTNGKSEFSKQSKNEHLESMMFESDSDSNGS
jgi:hypothetical protein